MTKECVEFWMVYAPSGSAPKKRHTSYEDARAEAERLVKTGACEEAFVLKAVDFVYREVSAGKMITVEQFEKLNRLQGETDSLWIVKDLDTELYWSKFDGMLQQGDFLVSLQCKASFYTAKEINERKLRHGIPCNIELKKEK